MGFEDCTVFLLMTAIAGSEGTPIFRLRWSHRIQEAFDG